MPESFQSLPFTYYGALREHLAQPGKATLEQASALGRAAMDGGLETVDLINMHHRALAEGVLSDAQCAIPERIISALDSFLLVALLPFRVDGGGPLGAREQKVGNWVEDYEALALRNAQLEEELAERQRAEAALQERKEHYFQLYQKARAMETNLRELSAQVLSAQEEERKRISRELHDEIGQALTAIDVTIAMLKRQVVSDPAFQRNVADAEQLLARTMETVHSFARELRPAMLDHLGLQSALRAHILAFTRQTGIRTELIAHPHLARLDERREEVLFRVAQEALNNVFKHAGATQARIEFTSTGDALDMEIGDNGCAFDVKEQLGCKRNGHLGLLGMQERVRLVNGRFSIESTAGNGTRIRVKLPLDPRPNGRARKMGGNGGQAPPAPSPEPRSSLYEENIRSPR
jgi:signal transduction histidine kinase